MMAAAPTTALRIRKLLRSTPVGTSCETRSAVLPNGSELLIFLSSLFDMIYLLYFFEHSVRCEPLQLIRRCVSFQMGQSGCSALTPAQELRIKASYGPPVSSA